MLNSEGEAMIACLRAKTSPPGLPVTLKLMEHVRLVVLKLSVSGCGSWDVTQPAITRLNASTI